ncbi:hypothetical protein ACG0Z5_15070 [Scandinavium sp. M-37]|jgi:hypothetical protein|uniref:hypothetical protein n=1 Tax=Scandinavium sp. M-37 TaxID=3373077 RepID=UPI0037471F12
MNFYLILITALLVKLLLTYALYKKNRDTFKRLSLKAKGAVVSVGWMISYGLSQLIGVLVV